MSRIGNMPITVPDGVKVNVTPENEVTVSGKNGELKANGSEEIKIEIEDNIITFTATSSRKEVRQMHGLTRSVVENMIEGVTKGFEKTLEIVGVGYRAQMQGNKLVLGLGYSHPIEIDQPENITFEVPNANTVIIKGIDKQQVGQVAANIREMRPPEPYKGKGIKYKGEHIRRKVGKTGM